MRPSAYLLRWLGLWFALALLLALARVLGMEQGIDLLATLIWLAALLLVLAALYDACNRKQLAALEVARELPRSLALGASHRILIRLANHSARPMQLVVTDHVPAQTELSGLPFSLTLPARNEQRLSFRLRALKRGLGQFDRLDLRILSPLKLWQFRLRAGEPGQVKIYPNFIPVIKLATLSLEQQTGRMGVHLQQRRGQGMEFHQLREFREGDVLRQVDWKASARHRKPISREYQAERDQDVLFLLDCGRRMRAKEEGVSHFDHCLNALLLTAYIALRQGDAIGFASFAGSQRWLQPQKGQQQINVLLNGIYDLHSSTEAADYLEAAAALVRRQRKRALVILITNARAEDSSELLAAAQLLRRHHLVIIASLREEVIDRDIDTRVSHFGQALAYSGAVAYQRQRREFLQRLHQGGANIVDALPKQLHSALVSEYLLMKRSGRM